MESSSEKHLLWNDWHWQMSNRVRDAASLSEWIPLSDKEIEEGLAIYKSVLEEFCKK